MAKSPKKRLRDRDPARAILEKLVLPAFEELVCEDENGPGKITVEEEDGQWAVCALLSGAHLVTVIPMPIDHERTNLRFELEGAVFLRQLPELALFVGALLQGSLFHVSMNLRATLGGRLNIVSDLTVRSDDQPLVFQRTLQLLGVGEVLEWYLTIHMPERLTLWELTFLQTELEESCGEDLGAVLDAGMETLPFMREAKPLLLIARGLGRWEDVLRLLAEHPDAVSAEEAVSLRLLAHRALKQWALAVEAAEAGARENGRIQDGPHSYPAYLHALIEAGRELDALRLLGSPDEEEPGYYDWFRSLALDRFGCAQGAEEAFERCRKAFPGDLMTPHLLLERPPFVAEE